MELARALDVDAEAAMREGGGDSGGGVEALTRACARAVERFVAPFWDAVERAEKEKQTEKASWNLSRPRPVMEPRPRGMDLRGGPSGSDETVRAAVAVLRVLHVNDMRELQTAVDALLVGMQEYTGDPKTNAKLGRVGKRMTRRVLYDITIRNVGKRAKRWIYEGRSQRAMMRR